MVLKNSVTILFILLFSYTWIVKTVVVIDYLVYKQQIIAEECVNKNKPTLHCNGKCHLAKQLSKTEQQGKQLPAQLFASKTEVFPHHTSEFIVLIPVDAPGRFTASNETPCDGFTSETVHPPSAWARAFIFLFN